MHERQFYSIVWNTSLAYLFTRIAFSQIKIRTGHRPENEKLNIMESTVLKHLKRILPDTEITHEAVGITCSNCSPKTTTHPDFHFFSEIGEQQIHTFIEVGGEIPATDAKDAQLAVVQNGIEPQNSPYLMYAQIFEEDLLELALVDSKQKLILYLLEREHATAHLDPIHFSHIGKMRAKLARQS